MYVCTCVHGLGNMCAQVRKSEVNLSHHYSRSHVHLGALFVLFVFWDSISHFYPEFANLARLPGQQVPEICLMQPPQHRDNYTSPHPCGLYEFWELNPGSQPCTLLSCFPQIIFASHNCFWALIMCLALPWVWGAPLRAWLRTQDTEHSWIPCLGQVFPNRDSYSKMKTVHFYSLLVLKRNSDLEGQDVHQWKRHTQSLPSYHLTGPIFNTSCRPT